MRKILRNIFWKKICLFFENNRQMDKDVESRLREKYALIDKSDPDQIAEAQKVRERKK